MHQRAHGGKQGRKSGTATGCRGSRTDRPAPPLRQVVTDHRVEPRCGHVRWPGVEQLSGMPEFEAGAKGSGLHPPGTSPKSPGGTGRETGGDIDIRTATDRHGQVAGIPGP